MGPSWVLGPRFAAVAALCRLHHWGDHYDSLVPFIVSIVARSIVTSGTVLNHMSQKSSICYTTMFYMIIELLVYRNSGTQLDSLSQS